MKRQELTEIGRVKRSHGLHGHLKIIFDSFYLDVLENFKAFILEKGEEYLPFFIEEADFTSNPSIIKFESLMGKEQAVKFNGQPVYVLTSHLPQVKENQKTLLEGMNVYDEQNRELGVIKAVLELPAQWVLQIDHGNEGELMVPFHEDFIIELNQAENRVQLQLPDGLLDIYRE